MHKTPWLTGLCAVAATAVIAGCGTSGGASLSADHYLPPVKLADATPNPTESAWPGAEHDASHSATVSLSVTGPLTGHVRWMRKLEGPVAPGPSVGVDGSIYVASNAGVLHALDPSTGRDRWRFAPPGTFDSTDLSTSPAVLPNGDLLWSGPGNALYALSPTGHELWHVALGSFVLSPTVVGRTAYVGEMNGDLHALDTATGHERWSIALGTGVSYAAAAVAADGTIYSTVDHDLVAVRDLGSKAAVLWRLSVGAIIEVSPAVAANGTVILGTNDPYEYGVSPTGKVLWRYRRTNQTYSSAGVTPTGQAIFGDNSGYLSVVNANTGAQIHHVRVNGLIWTSPAIDAHGDIYFGTHSGQIYGLSPSGAQLFDIATGGSVESYPALDAHGTLYIGSANGDVYAIGR